MQVYIWGTDVTGESLGNEFEIGFDKILENLNFALMGGVTARRGDWGWFLDASYADITGENALTVSVLPGEPAGGVDIDLEMDIKQTVLNFGAAYRLAETDSYRLYGTLGARYLGLDTELKTESPVRSRRFSSYQSSWDLTVGVNGQAAINDTWFVPFAFDIGAG